ncbi:MAG: hypothetical protein HGA95_05110 [Caldiserica bacterium]|nr:hypothetical protein [Caldisericota bacterium]
MSREFILVLYRSLKAIIAAMEKEYKLGVYAVAQPIQPSADDSISSYVLDN